MLAEYGIAVRLVYDEERGTYRVEHTRVLKDGSLSSDWRVFGGFVGYDSSAYSDEDEALSNFEYLKPGREDRPPNDSNLAI